MNEPFWALAVTRSLSWSTTSIGSPLLVGALGVARPAGHDGGAARDLAVVLEVVADHGQQPLRDPVAGLGAQAGDGVTDLGIGEALDQRRLVVVEVDAGDGAQRRRSLVVHVAAQERAVERVLGGLVDEPVAVEVGEVAERLVARVEQAQLHQLVGLDVVDDLDADVLVGRAAERERVLEHPLRERLADHRPGVVDVEALLDLGAVGVGGLRRDPVDHRVRERDAVERSPRRPAPGRPGACGRRCRAGCRMT